MENNAQNDDANVANYTAYDSNHMQPRVQRNRLSLFKRDVSDNILKSESFSYDGFGNISTAHSIWDKKTLSYNYNTGSSNEILSTNITVKNGSSESQLLTHTLSSASDMRDNIASSVYTTPNGTGSDTTAYNYTYDALGRLTGETKVKNGTTQSTTGYTYNAGGNRTQMVKGTIATTYTYETGWKDRLASIKTDGTNGINFQYIFYLLVNTITN